MTQVGKARWAIIGGTGLYALEGLEVIEERQVNTPFGSPSAPVLIGRLGEAEVVFLPRHGRHHEYLPSEVNYRANLWALKECGARAVLSVSATGSLREEIQPGELALVNQYIDWTKGRRDHTYFGAGVIAHQSTAEPSCPEMTRLVLQVAEELGIQLHHGKTYACVEGPRLGTKAESHFLRTAGADLVGMTNVPEAFLAREAQLAYLTVAVATDYDCWRDDPNEHANLSDIIAQYQKSVATVQKILLSLLKNSPRPPEESFCYTALENAIVTPPDAIPEDRRKIIDFLRQ